MRNNAKLDLWIIGLVASLLVPDHALARGVLIRGNKKHPHQVSLHLQEHCLLQADLIIALDEQEQRPFVRERISGWENKIEYWHVHDLHLATADEALLKLEHEVRGLVERLARTGA